MTLLQYGVRSPRGGLASPSPTPPPLTHSPSSSPPCGLSSRWSTRLRSGAHTHGGGDTTETRAARVICHIRSAADSHRQDFTSFRSFYRLLLLHIEVRPHAHAHNIGPTYTLTREHSHACTHALALSRSDSHIEAHARLSRHAWVAHSRQAGDC